MLTIESSKVADERGDDKTKQFAAKMIEENSKSVDALKGLVQSAERQYQSCTSANSDDGAYGPRTAVFAAGLAIPLGEL